MKPEMTATPRLAAGVRLNEKSQQPRMLLMPERALRLNGPSLEIVQLCDGKHTVQQPWTRRHDRTGAKLQGFYLAIPVQIVPYK